MVRIPAFLARNVLPELEDSNEVTAFVERAAHSVAQSSVLLNRKIPKEKAMPKQIDWLYERGG